MRYYQALFVAPMLGVSLFVQLVVYGATLVRSNGSLLPELRPVFGLWYGLAFLAFQVWYCAVCAGKGFVILLIAWGLNLAVGLGVLLRGGNPDLTPDAAVALGAGVSALFLAADYYSRRT